MWLVGVVVRRYIDYLILLIPTPRVSVLFCSSIPTFCSFFLNVFRSLFIYSYTNVHSCNLAGSKSAITPVQIV